MAEFRPAGSSTETSRRFRPVTGTTALGDAPELVEPGVDYFDVAGRKLWEAGESARGGMEAFLESAEPTPRLGELDLGEELKQKGSQLLRIAGGVLSPFQAVAGAAVGAPVETALRRFLPEEAARLGGTASEFLFPLAYAKLAQAGKAVIPTSATGVALRELLGAPPPFETGPFVAGAQRRIGESFAEATQPAKELEQVVAPAVVEEAIPPLSPTRALAQATETASKAIEAEALGAKSLARRMKEEAQKEADAASAAWLQKPRPGSTTLAGSVAGSLAGFEQDDDGNIWFDPGKALVGATVGAAGLAVGATAGQRYQQALIGARQFASWMGRQKQLLQHAFQGRQIPTKSYNDITRSVLQKFVFPHTYADAQPLFAPVYQGGLRFFEDRARIGGIFTEKLGDVLQGVSKKVQQTLDTYSFLGRDWTVQDLQRSGLNAREIQQAGQVRDALEFGLDELERSLVRRGHDPTKAAAAIGQLKRKGFTPFTRFGNYRIDITDANNNLVFTSFQEGKLAHNAAKAEARGLVPSGGTMRASEVKGIPQEVAGGLDVATLAALARVEKDVQQVLGQTQTVPLSLTKLIARAQVGGGFPTHLLRRRNIPGFEEDMPRRLAAYGRSLSHYVAASEFRHGSAPAIRAIDQAGKSSLVDYASRYVDDVSNPSGDFGRLREALFVYYLGGKASSALINLSGHLTLGYPVVGRYSKNAMKQWTRGIREGFLDDSRLAPDISNGLRLANLEGVVGDPTTQELLGTASGRGAMLRGASDLMGALFGKAEHAIRRASYITGQNIAREELRLAPQEAHEFAKKLTRESNLEYSKADRPEIVRSGMMAPFGTFRLFTWNVLSKFKDAAKRGEYGTLARHLGTLGAVAGLAGMPGAKLLIDSARSLGYDIPTWVREKFGRAGEVALRGPAYAAGALWGEPDKGIDLSGAAGLGDVVPSELFTDPFEGVSKLVGGVLADPVVRATRAARLYSRGEPERALETLMPEALRSALVAKRGVTEGAFTTPYGEPLYVPSSFDIAMKAAGFQPTGLSRAYEREAAERALRVSSTSQAEYFYRNIAKAVVSLDSEAVSAALAEVTKYNAEVAPEARITLGTSSARAAIRRHVLSFTRPEITEEKALPRRARPRFREIQRIYGGGK